MEEVGGTTSTAASYCFSCSPASSGVSWEQSQQSLSLPRRICSALLPLAAPALQRRETNSSCRSIVHVPAGRREPREEQGRSSAGSALNLREHSEKTAPFPHTGSPQERGKTEESFNMSQLATDSEEPSGAMLQVGPAEQSTHVLSRGKEEPWHLLRTPPH